MRHLAFIMIIDTFKISICLIFFYIIIHFLHFVTNFSIKLKLILRDTTRFQAISLHYEDIN